eukprot:TRINITY_DN8700_c0_g1_i2.p1 TRINITY_DN8700_c0_g1~~TRINITY_DN8700_c0_g1_i2.p1  ORF type:complete len:457 (-),score=51.44 TRINITY_DN8700_c0_g1_i2:604-1974(-)
MSSDHADRVIDAAYGKGRYQAAAFAVLLFSYLLTVPGILIQPLVLPKLVSDSRFPAFTSEVVASCQTLVFLGFACGTLALFPVCDIIGRKPTVLTLTYLCIATCICTAAAPLTGSVSLYAASLLVQGAAQSCAPLSYVYLSEIVPQRHRDRLTVLLNVGYSAYLFVAAVVLGTVMRGWDFERSSLAWLSLHVVPAFVGLLVLWESVPWLYKRRSRRQATAVAVAIAQVNGASGPLPDLGMVSSGDCRNHSGGAEGDASKEVLDRRWPLWIFRDRRYGCRLALLSVSWIAVSLSYYGLSYAAGGFSSDIYFNTACFACADIVGYFLPLVLAPLLGGQQRTQACSLAVASLLLAACGLLPRGSPAVNYCAVLARLCVDVAFSTNYRLVAANFPTECCSTAMGFVGFCGRFSTLLAPLMGQLPTAISCPLFGALCLAGAVCTVCLSVDDERTVRIDLEG